MRYVSKNRFGVFHYRRPVPPALQPVIGRTELKTSLKTTGEREARAAWPAAHAWAEKVLADARRVSAGGTKKVLHRVIIDAVDSIEPTAPLMSGIGDERPLLPSTIVEFGNADWREAEIQRLAAAAGITPDSAAWDAFEQAAHAALDHAAWARAHAVAGLPQPAHIAAQIDAAKRVTVGDAMGRWIDRRAKRIGRKGAAEAKRAATLFGDERDMRAVQKIDAIHFRDQMLAEGKAVSTVKKYFTYLSGAFAEIAEEMTPEPANPFAGLKFVEVEAPEEARRAFTETNISDFFSLPAFRHPEATADGAAMFWIPLLALTTGARQNEIVQLTANDIASDGGVAYIDINPGRRGAKKRVKNRDSIRRVPVPASLIKIGFLDYVATKKARLFDLEPDVHGNAAGLFSKRINREIDRVDDDPALTFHSFRHTFIQRAAAASVRPDFLMALVGHYDASTTARSYRMRLGLSLAALKKEIDRLKFPLDIAALRKAAKSLT